MCSLAQTGISHVSIPQYNPNTWIIDFGATDHMTHKFTHFLTYNPCSRNKKIIVADGTVVVVVGQGNISLILELELKNVLHVPKLSTNLISIYQATKDLNCCITFYPTHCVF